ncbi:MAG: type II toxin-antitoxin system HicB family antitoxin [Blastocatellia bacterium]
MERTKAKKNAERLLPPHRADEYHYTVGWSEEDRAFVGRVAEFESLAAHGRTLESALREIKSVVKTVLEDLVASGEEITQPFSKRRFSGKLNLRMPESMHRQLALEAARQGISLNQLINLKLTVA